MAALGGVVVDDVEDHLDPGLVQRPDHGLELRDLFAPRSAGAIGVVRGEQADRVVAPVVRQPASSQAVVRHELVDRHQLDRRDSQLLQVTHDRRMRQPLVGPAQFFRYLGMQPGQAPHMRFVDHGFAVGSPGRPVQVPVEVRIHHHRPRHVRRRVRIAALVRAAQGVGIYRGVPADASLNRLRVRIQQQLGRVAAASGGRIIGAADPVPVTLARPDTRQITVPDEPVHLPQRHPGLRAIIGEQAQVHLLRHLREQGEVSPRTVISRPQRIAVARPHRPVPCHRSALPPKAACHTTVSPGTAITPVAAPGPRPGMTARSRGQRTPPFASKTTAA